jgi:hypothetical protein
MTRAISILALKRRCAALAAAALCALVCIDTLAAESPPDAVAGPSLLAALKEGGLVLYFRHTSTDFGQNDDQMSGYADCARQRNLTDSGREEARQIGAAIRRLGIPVGEVRASPFCRTRETAQLIFGRATVSSAVRGGPPNPESSDRYQSFARFSRAHFRRAATGSSSATATPSAPSPPPHISRRARPRVSILPLGVRGIASTRTIAAGTM